MKKYLEQLLQQAIATLKQDGVIDREVMPSVQVERTKDPSHGDFASNLALVLAKPARMKPRELAEKIAGMLDADAQIERVEIAGPGFINFFLGNAAQHQVVHSILAEGEAFGRSAVGQGQRIQVEYVSANPTGPLHVGHGRGAAYGSALASLLRVAGYTVEQEYYVNDAGRQMDILATSIWLRYLACCGEQFDFPSNGYRGGYVLEIAEDLKSLHGDRFVRSEAQVFQNIPADEPAGGDKEKHIDALIERAKSLLGEDAYEAVFQAGLGSILGDIQDDLKEFRVQHDNWFSERSLMNSDAVDNALKVLEEKGYLYTQEGAVWFRSSELGDEKDRVVVRENGQKTYFASDIAYHMNKLERGYDRIINIWGADHHGYVPRVRAAIQALGGAPEKLDVLLVQFAVLYRGNEKVQMSTRSGEFVTLRQLREEVGNDAARFFYVMRKSDQHMDFDLDLATSRSNENPVYYVQYAHARICSVFAQMPEKQLTYDREDGLANLGLLSAEHEAALFRTLGQYPEMIEKAAQQHEPHQLINYLRDLANDFHTYYNAHQFLVSEPALCNARLALIGAVRQVIANGLAILGITAPETM